MPSTNLSNVRHGSTPHGDGAPAAATSHDGPPPCTGHRGGAVVSRSTNGGSGRPSRRWVSRRCHRLAPPPHSGEGPSRPGGREETGIAHAAHPWSRGSTRAGPRRGGWQRSTRTTRRATAKRPTVRAPDRPVPAPAQRRPHRPIRPPQRRPTAADKLGMLAPLPPDGHPPYAPRMSSK